jgi:hypothetical protein
MVEIETKLTGLNTLMFNTGRPYREAGQRIGVAEIWDGLKFMVDVDRGLDYIFPAECEMRRGSVMHHYDNNLRFRGNVSCENRIWLSALRREIEAELLKD